MKKKSTIDEKAIKNEIKDIYINIDKLNKNL